MRLSAVTNPHSVLRKILVCQNDNAFLLADCSFSEPQDCSHPYPQPAVCLHCAVAATSCGRFTQSEGNKCFLAEAAVAGLWLSVEVDFQSEKAPMVGTG
ncbi:hypothetical protein CgunFtcFv8_026359 [Champsocephalus gunnari]|uniref:Uncharacterized protein n=1 Tax=Champsocephalus gunnari TaxID=52237 RepID=A0AAN8DWW2_CHAGU|nr:hypothetical protein CgunFtcFv8_026359 [Champsocephalus gunnari]